MTESLLRWLKEQDPNIERPGLMLDPELPYALLALEYRDPDSPDDDPCYLHIRTQLSKDIREKSNAWDMVLFLIRNAFQCAKSMKTTGESIANDMADGFVPLTEIRECDIVIGTEGSGWNA